LEEIDKTKNLVAIVNDRHIFPHAKSGDEEARLKVCDTVLSERTLEQFEAA